MLFPVALALFITIASTEPPQFIFRAGHCPNHNSTTNFDPSVLYNVEWKLVMHTDPDQETNKCCKCVTIRYQQDGSKFTSYRSGYKTNSSVQVKTWSRFSPITPFNGKYRYEYKDDINNEWQELQNMKIAFRSFDPNFNYFMVYGCIDRQHTFADVALFLTRSSDPNQDKINAFQTFLNTSKPEGVIYHYYSIPSQC